MVINKKFIYILFTLVFFVFLFWLLLYAKFIANESVIINLRNIYFLHLDKITPKNLFIYSTRPYKHEGGGYFIYKFPGKFQSFDFVNSIIVLNDLNGKEWKFKYYTNTNPNLSNDMYNDELLFKMDTVKKDNSFTTQIYKIVINTQNFNNNDQIFSKDDVIVIYWKDNRKLQDIINASNLGETIEMNPANMIQIQKIIWE